MTTPHDTHATESSGAPSRLLLGLTGALLALMVLNLVLFDDLRTDPSATALETFTKPPHLSSLAVVLIAGIMLLAKHRSAARVTAIVAWAEIAGFTFFHLIPVEFGPTKPYWGEGMGDALQWFGLVSILAVCVAIVRAARATEARGGVLSVPATP